MIQSSRLRAPVIVIFIGHKQNIVFIIIRGCLAYQGCKEKWDQRGKDYLDQRWGTCVTVWVVFSTFCDTDWKFRGQSLNATNNKKKIVGCIRCINSWKYTSLSLFRLSCVSGWQRFTRGAGAIRSSWNWTLRNKGECVNMQYKVS